VIHKTSQFNHFPRPTVNCGAVNDKEEDALDSIAIHDHDPHRITFRIQKLDVRRAHRLANIFLKENIARQKSSLRLWKRYRI